MAELAKIEHNTESFARVRRDRPRRSLPRRLQVASNPEPAMLLAPASLASLLHFLFDVISDVISDVIFEFG